MIRRYLPGGYRSLHGLTIGSILLTMFIQIALWWTLPHDVFYGPDPGVKFLQVINFSLHDQSLAYPGRVLDPSLRFAPFDSPFVVEKNGDFYGIYNPLFVMLSYLFYSLFGYTGLYIIPLLSSLALLILTVLLVREVGPYGQAFVPPIVGLGSPLLFYAFTFWEHMPGVALATGSVLLCYVGNQRNQTWGKLFLAGVVAGLSCALRPELGAWCLAMLLSALLVWPEHRGSMFLAFSTGVMLVIGLFQVYEWITFGALVRSQVTNNYGTFLVEEAFGWFNRQAAFMLTMLLPAQQRLLWKLLWSGVLLLVLIGTTVRQPTVQTSVRILVFILTVVMGGLLLKNIGSDMVFDDVTQTFPLICFIGLAWVTPRTTVCAGACKLLRFLLRTVGIFLVLVFLLTFNDGGGQWGPRYLLVILPALTVILAGWLIALDRNAIHPLFLVPGALLLILLLIQSFVIQYQGVAQLRAQQVMQQEMNRHVALLPEQIVVVDWLSTSFVLAPSFYEKTLLLVSTPEEVEPLMHMLQVHGITDFAYVSLVLNREETYHLPLDFPGATRCCLELQDDSSVTYRRSYHQAVLYVHFVVQRYRIENVSVGQYRH